MFECTLQEGELFKKIVAALSDLVTEGNFMIDSHQISFQGMDSSHVSLVALSLKENGFQPYRCDRDLSLGINFASLNKILKCMASKDVLSIRAEDDSDSAFFIFSSTDQKRVSNFELKLMDIESDQLGIPETDYNTTIQMPSSEFQRICRDLSAIGDSVNISASKQGVKFSVSGDIGSGDMILKGRMTGRRKKKKTKTKNDDNKEENNNNNNNNEVSVKKEKNDSNDPTPGNDEQNAVTQDIDGDEAMTNNEPENENNKEKEQENEKEKEKEKKDDMDQDQEEEEEEEYEGNVDDDEKNNILINLNEDVTQTFALRYLNNFTKATSLSTNVTLSMGGEVPLMVEYKFGQSGYIRYYLAPKIDEDE